jgi:hypothetical protein
MAKDYFNMANADFHMADADFHMANEDFHVASDDFHTAIVGCRYADSQSKTADGCLLAVLSARVSKIVVEPCDGGLAGCYL